MRHDFHELHKQGVYLRPAILKLLINAGDATNWRNSVKIINLGLWRIVKESFGQMNQVLHFFWPLAEFTSGNCHPNRMIRIVCYQEWNMARFRHNVIFCQTHHYPTRSHHWQRLCEYFEWLGSSMVQTLSPNGDAVYQDDNAPVHLADIFQGWFPDHQKMKFHIYNDLHNHLISILLKPCGLCWREMFDYSIYLHKH